MVIGNQRYRRRESQTFTKYYNRDGWIKWQRQCPSCRQAPLQTRFNARQVQIFYFRGIQTKFIGLDEICDILLI